MPFRSLDGVMIGVDQGQELFGHYQRPEPFPAPLPDDLHSHDGWTWGSVAAVFAESSDRIWIAQRGELPLPEGADPWTPYSLLNPSRGSAPATTDGISSTCRETGNLRGYERRFLHVIFVVDSDGNLVDEWPQHDALFGAQPCGRGPHKIKISPYDPEKHVWVIDDQLHVIYKFTQEGELVHTLGELGVRGRGPNNFDRPTDIAWLPDGTYFISDGYGGTRVAKFDADNNFVMDWGGPPPIEPTPAQTNSTPSTASRSAPTGGSTSSIAPTPESRYSTRTATSWTCSRPAPEPAPARTPTRSSVIGRPEKSSSGSRTVERIES